MCYFEIIKKKKRKKNGQLTSNNSSDGSDWVCFWPDVTRFPACRWLFSSCWSSHADVRLYWTHVSVCHLYLELSLSAVLCSVPSTCPTTSCYLYVNTMGSADCGSVQSSHSVKHVFLRAAHIFLLIIQFHVDSCQFSPITVLAMRHFFSCFCG